LQNASTPSRHHAITPPRHHAIFDYLSHNLILLMELEMKHQGLIDEVKAKKRIGREKTRRNRAGEITKSAANP
jgi:hypothetical protein